MSEPERILGAPLWLLRQEPDHPLAQLRLLAFQRVHAAVIELGIDPASGIFRMRNAPVPSLGNQTLFEVVRDGRADQALGYLHSIGAGFVGQSINRTGEHHGEGSPERHGGH